MLYIGIMFLPEAISCQWKPSARWETPPLWLLVMDVPESPPHQQTIQAIAVTLARTTSRWQVPTAEGTIYSGHGTWRNHVGTDLEAFSMMARFHSTGRCCAGCWGWCWDDHQECYLSLDAMSYSLNHVRCAQNCNSGTNIIKITNHFVITSKILSTEESTCPILQICQRTRCWGANKPQG